MSDTTMTKVLALAHALFGLDLDDIEKIKPGYTSARTATNRAPTAGRHQ